MKVEIKPSLASGKISAPPSKSMAHRLLICAGLSEGTSIIHGIAPSEDILATIDCLSAIGAECKYDGDTVTVVGTDVKNIHPRKTLFCRECGSTLRFFIPICLLSEDETTLTGSTKLLSRPLDIYSDLCSQKGLAFKNDGEKVSVKGKLQSGEYRLPGNVSSQFITGLLFALSTLEGESRICITNGVDSRSYIDLTVSALKQFGIDITWEDEKTIFIPGGQRYTAGEVCVEGDYSNAAFFEALNLIGGNVEMSGLKEDSLQGDRIYKEYFAKISSGFPTFSLGNCPDLGPIMFAACAMFNGAVFTQTRRLKIKESDRGAAMAEELGKFGINLKIEDDRITVLPSKIKKPSEELCSHNDHRIAMALSVLLTKFGGIIDGAEAVAKSMPDFFDVLKTLGIAVNILN